MSALAELRKRVEAATGPDREIDLLIGLTIDGWQIGDLIDGRFAPILGGTLVRDSSGNINVAAPGGMYPAPTESIDEALALVERKLPGLSWKLQSEPEIPSSPGVFASLMRWDDPRLKDTDTPIWLAKKLKVGVYTDHVWSARGATAPLAILSALLHALEPEPPHGR